MRHADCSLRSSPPAAFRASLSSGVRQLDTPSQINRISEHMKELLEIPGLISGYPNWYKISVLVWIFSGVGLLGIRAFVSPQSKDEKTKPITGNNQAINNSAGAIQISNSGSITINHGNQPIPTSALNSVTPITTITGSLTLTRSERPGINGICLSVTSDTNTPIDTYSARILVEENATLMAQNFKLIDPRHVSQKHGRLLWGKMYQRVISPTSNCPLWKGHYVNLFELNDSVSFNNNADWESLWIISELSIPGLNDPITNRIEIIHHKGGYTCNYQ
jgi:hypothetical protein